MRKGTKVNKKRLGIFIAILIIIILLIVVICKAIGNKSEITLNGKDKTIDGNNMSNSQEIEYDGNPYNVPQDYTETVNEYVGESGEAIDENTLSGIKQSIMDKFKGIPADKLKLDINMDNSRIIFNQGTTIIANNKCLVFVVYEEKDGALNFISKYAMSIDTSVLYKYDSDALIFNMLEI